MVPAHAVVDKRNELLCRLQGSEATGEDVVSLVAQPPDLFHNPRRIISESSLTLGSWIESYSRSPNTPQANTGQHIADWISGDYQDLGHTSVLTLADLQHHGLNAGHMNNYTDVQEYCMEALHAALVAFELTDTVKVVRCHLDESSNSQDPCEFLRRHPPLSPNPPMDTD